MNDQTQRASHRSGALRSDVAFGLSAEDLAREADRFGVSDEQVRRDHAISHVLAAISEEFAHDVIFFGGTALSLDPPIRYRDGAGVKNEGGL